MKTVQPSRLLKSVFLLDAAASGAIAAAHLLLPGVLGATLALPRPLLIGTGLFLVLYVAMLLAMAQARVLWHALGMVVVLGNVGWALGSFALLASGVVVPSALGNAYVIVQALGVFAFAVLEYRGLAGSPVVRSGGAVAA